MASRKCPHGRHVERGDGAGHETEDNGDTTTEEGKQRVKNQISRHREDVSGSYSLGRALWSKWKVC